MIPIDQTRLSGPNQRGNCMQAAVASLLELPLDRVPNFIEARDRGGHEELAMRRFLLGLGFEVVRLPGNHVSEGYCLAVGPTDRGTHHMVVVQDGELVHDPHPSRQGLRAVSFVYLLVPLDPARSLPTRRLG